MADLKFEILEEFGTLATSKSGWELQLNFVKWGANQPKFDLRTWSPDHKKMGKGITLTHDELVNLDQVIDKVLAPEAAITAVEEAVDQDDSPLAGEEDLDQGNQANGSAERPKWHKLTDI
ncbi:YdbC family protein [Weissella halotolerans]|uniref:Transcriptional coactivator p15 (PC4) C-terminal domain-containing protein n=1 Tax=Weissella halotolerans DSM 20190 TaxID=1123500 RepID=A0A0R2FX17_9LACO|nr:PC4/YdbC family ssDNA-binding protein [Weissella halotolerans]KRN32203.1 hypothetical protein IV68_GL000552 [Weissella halotolerans DSM 20190]